MFDGLNGETALNGVTVNPNNIIINTCKTDGSLNTVYLIDFGQKKKGTLKISILGNTGSNNSLLYEPAFYSRGILFGNGDIVKNWSMGGHSTGAMLGVEASYSNETRNHIQDIKDYYNNSINAVIFEAPIVNEYLKQTPIQTFKDRLTQIKTNLNTDNFLVVTTLGQKSKEFPNQISNGQGTFDDYSKAVKDWALLQGGSVTYFDGRTYIKDLVARGLVQIDDLYINDNHPSPLVNELLFNQFKIICDMKF
jgi:hypothetical protein